jgi:GT2 family glycosyltransferase
MYASPPPFMEVDTLPRPVADDITVLIPTLGRPILKTSLEWLLAGTVWPAELIVVDQSSSVEVETWLARLHSLGLQTRYVPLTGRGKAMALNRGLDCIATRFIAVTDDDCFVAHDWLEKMVVRLRERPDAILTGRMEPEGDGAVVATVTSIVPGVYSRPPLKHDASVGGDFGFSMAVVKQVGRFDEDPHLSPADDVEWAYRAIRTGVPIIYAPEIMVRHIGWRHTEQRAGQYRAYARSHGNFYGKYLRRGDWFIALRVVIHLIRALRRWLRGIATGNQEQIINGRAYVLHLIPGIIAGVRGGRSS